jgi:hypothetical protein
MKNLTLTILLFITTALFSQEKDSKTLIDEMNNFYNRSKIEKLEVLTSEILSGKYGSIDDELKFYALMYSTNVFTSDNYTKKDPQKGYDKAIELIEFVKTTNYNVPNKDAYLKSMIDFMPEYIKKFPNVQTEKSNRNGTNSQDAISTSSNTENNSSSSDNKTVTLTVSGSGKTIEEARLNALRSAIEQAFGAFISSKTEILNDNVVKDEIVSVSNGSIQKFNIVSEVEIPNTGFATTLNATVSVSKLTTFVESKGVVAEFKGNLFSFNIKQQILNEDNEVKAIRDLCETAKQIFDKSVDYQITPENPVALDNTNQNWAINLNVKMSINNNILSLADYMYKTLNNISMSKSDVINYKNLGKVTYPISFASDKKSFSYVSLRKEESFKLIINLIKHFDKSAVDFNVINGASTINMKDNFNDFNSISESIIRIDMKYSDAMKSASIFNENSARNIYHIEMNTDFFNNQFRFITKLLGNYEYETKTDRLWIDNNWKNFEIKIYNPGVIISFLMFREPTGSVSLQYVDKRTLDEINKITEYKISKK